MKEAQLVHLLHSRGQLDQVTNKNRLVEAVLFDLLVQRSLAQLHGDAEIFVNGQPNHLHDINVVNLLLDFNFFDEVESQVDPLFIVEVLVDLLANHLFDCDVSPLEQR